MGLKKKRKTMAWGGGGGKSEKTFSFSDSIFSNAGRRIRVWREEKESEVGERLKRQHEAGVKEGRKVKNFLFVSFFFFS